MMGVTDQLRKMSNAKLLHARNFQEGRLSQAKEKSHFESKEDLELCRRILFETYQELDRRGLL